MVDKLAHIKHRSLLRLFFKKERLGNHTHNSAIHPIPSPKRSCRFPVNIEPSAKIAFTFSVIALAAKLAKSDGVVNNKELESITIIFPMAQDYSDKISRMFIDAYTDNTCASHYANHIVRYFGSQHPLISNVLLSLCKFAMTDGPINKQEMQFLQKIGLVFGYSNEQIHQYIRSLVLPNHSDPFAIMGVTKDITFDALKQTYRTLAKECHPDRLGLENPSELVSLAQEKFSRVTKAYQEICHRQKFA